MFLKEFAIRRYGPLTDSGKRVLEKFNLFYGPNEEGKTLTIDALLKMLVGKAAGRQFSAVKRVEENPDGYLIIKDNSKNEIMLPEAGTLTDLFGLEASEFVNVFVIRDSDLSINDESGFYHRITSRLTGIRSDEIRRIKERVYELGCITTGGDFQNLAPLKLKDRYKKGQGLLERIDPLLAAAEEEGFSLFEEELARLECVQLDLTEKLKQCRDAQGRERYEKGRKSLNRLLEALSEFEKLEPYSENDYDTWQRIEMGLEYLLSDLLQIDSEAAEKKKGLEAARSLRQSKAVALRKIESELKETSETIEPLLAEYDRQHEFLVKQKALVSNRYFNPAALVMTLILIIALSGAVMRPAWWLFAMVGLSGFIILLLCRLYFTVLRNKSRLDTVEMRICSKAEELGFSADGIHDVRSGFGRLKSQAGFAAENLNEAEKEAEWQHKELDRSRERLEEQKRRIKDSEVKLERMSQELSVKSLAEFSALLKRKEEQRNEIDKHKSVLESHFGRSGEHASARDRIRYWKEQVEELSHYAALAPDLKYDQQAAARLSEEIEITGRRSRELQAKMKERLEELRDLEKEVNALLYPDGEGYLPCQTILDLEMIRKKLQEWVAERDENKQVAGVALEILADLEEAEEQKVTALFGRKSPVSVYFNRITGGRYREVLFESRENPIKAVSQNGIELDAVKLSGGTFDQLYFAIRLALGEKLFKGDKGFFILDDPFIKADPVRLETMLAMLFEVCASGWQVLYFSSKGEVKEALKKKIKAGEVSEFSTGLN